MKVCDVKIVEELGVHWRGGEWPSPALTGTGGERVSTNAK